MLNFITILLWLVILAGALTAIAVHVFLGRSIGSIGLADLQGMWPFNGPVSRWMEVLQEYAAGADVKFILSVALTLIGVLLILRAVSTEITAIRKRGSARRSKKVAPPHAAASVNRRGRVLAGGLTGQLVMVLTIAVALFGLCVVSLTYFTVTTTLRDYQHKETTVLAVKVTDSIANYLVAKRTTDLSSFLRKSASGAATAYIVVEDRKGALAAHSLGKLPYDLRTSLGLEPPREIERRTLSVDGRGVYEVAVPLADGQAGVVRLGVWAEEIESEIWRSIEPVMLWLLAVFAAGLFFAIYLARRINRPIVKLVRIASDISLGALDLPLSGTRDPGEFGELSRALERLRFTVKSTMARLD